MKNTKISALLFGLAAAYQIFLVHFLTVNATTTNIAVAMNVEILAVLAMAALALWMNAKDALCCNCKIALVGGTVLYGLFLGFNFSVEKTIIQYAFSTATDMGADSTAIYAFIVKAILLVGAVVFALLPEKAAAEPVLTEADIAAVEEAAVLEAAVAEAAEAAIEDAVSKE